jgi:hypothetical protein
MKSLVHYSYHCQFSEVIFPAATTIVPYPEAKNITVGDAYYGAARFLPPSRYLPSAFFLGGGYIF